jgi:ribonuclease HI
MSIAKKYYVVWKGRKRGVFDTWDQCLAQVNGFPGAQYKAFPSRELALSAWERPYASSWASTKEHPTTAGKAPKGDAIAVDASCIGNPGPVEFRGIRLADGKQIFRHGPLANGTNNIGEFLAIVSALEYLKNKNLSWPIYTDSKIALSWIRKKSCQTKLVSNKANAELFQLIQRAEEWLRTNEYKTPILKWKTETWGENPADFGRK